MSDKKAIKIQMMTQPRDWAPAARAHLFGLESLTPDEFAIEGTRMSGGEPKYGEDVYRQAASMAARMKRRA